MKRSEMVEIIQEFLDLIKDDPKIHNGNTKDHAEYILGCCETWGMLPPENPNISQHVIDNCLSGNYWESEDE